MTVYIAGDVHLRLDHPERGRRFARWVAGLGGDDSLWIVGDLCDFWFAARECNRRGPDCDGLRALVAFQARGGVVRILPGNHDAWLGPFFERTLGVGLLAEPVEIAVYGVRVRMVHGHLLGARRLWKSFMEGRGFLALFRRLPGPLARGLDRLLTKVNEKGRAASDARHLATFRRYAERVGAAADLVVVGHLHTPLDDFESRPRLIVPGGWHRQSSYVKIDASGAELVIERDPAPIPK